MPPPQHAAGRQQAAAARRPQGAEAEMRELTEGLQGLGAGPKHTGGVISK